MVGMNADMLRTMVSALVLSVSVIGTARAAQAPASAQTTVAKPAAAMVNLNTATQSELEALPGIGPKVAARIIEYRKSMGPFKKIEEVMNVQGVGEKSFLKLRPQLTVGTKPEPAAGQQ